MAYIQQLIHYILHIDSYLISFVATYGSWTYFVLFAIIFCETGLIIMPFLPGDSLLFTAGSIAAHPDSTLKASSLILFLIIASILGNTINYLAGRCIGPRVFSLSRHYFFNQKHLAKAHLFYQKHGGKTIVLARFIPIIRTFVPFIAGVAYMNMTKFGLYNLASAILWIGTLIGAGYFFGSLAFVKNHFSLVVYGIIIISLLPPVCALLYQKATKPNG